MHYTTRTPRALLAVLVSFLLVVLGLPSLAAAADNDGEITVESYVTNHQGEVTTIPAGDFFSLTINLQCSSPDTGICTNTVLDLDLPEPIEFLSDPLTVSPAVATGVVTGGKLRVTFDGQGLTAGQLVVLTAKVIVPSDASGNLDGDTVSAGVVITADNADTVTDSIAMKLSIPPVLVAVTTKAVSPTGTQPALSGRVVTYNLTGANSANVSVDSVQIAEPTNPTSSTPFTYLAVTGIDTLTAPEGADRVRFEWFDGSDWQDSGTVAVPADPDTLLPADPSLIRGMRFTFTKDGGLVPAGDAAHIVITTETRSDAFADLSSGDTRTIANQASTIVSYGGESSDDQATGSVTFKMSPVEVTTAKTITGSSLVAGATTVVTIDATNGIMPVSTMQIDEPAAGEANLVDQGLEFTGFVTSGATDQRVTWPHNATTAQITYFYSDDTAEVLSTSTIDTMPAPADGKTVKSFSVVFTGANDAIISGASAKLAFTVTAGAVSQEAGVSATNTVKTTVTDASTTVGSSTAADTVTLLPQRVRTGASKTLSRESLWAAPGSAMTVSLTGSVSQESTIGSEYLTLTDNTYPFWDSFDLRRIIATDIPADAQLNLEYYDGSTWQTLTTKTGPSQDWSYTPSNPDQIAGIRFKFTPLNAGEVLPVGFNVAPRFEVALRRYLRSDALIPTSSTAPTTIANQVTTEVSNPVAIQPLVTKTASDSVELKTTDGTGGGAPDLIAKNWVTGSGLANEYQVYALSGDTRTARIDWDTDGLSMSQLQVTDDPRGTDGGSIATSVYDAFDLVAIEPITPAIDPLIANDKIAKVELYTGSGWTDVTSQACPSAAACDGEFPGYTLTAGERAATLAVRLTIEAGSASDTGAIAVSGSATPSRGILLTMRLRNTLRSAPTEYVLGTSHDYAYNTGSKGVISNRADVVGTLTTPTEAGTTSFADSASASLIIYDRPLNISLSKTFDQDRLGLPQAATNSQSDYPLITSTLTARNNTATFVPEILIADPSPAVSGLGAYDYLNLYQIEAVEIPADLSTSEVTVDLVHFDGTTTTTEAGITLAEAQGRSPAQLGDVIGVSVHYGAVANLGDSTKALIASGSTATLNLTYQLRANLRSDGAPTVPTEQITNSARATIVSPGGMGCTGGEDCDQPTADDTDSFGIVQPTYDVTAGKAISPSSRYEDQTSNYTVTLAGQPSGTARTKLLALTDQTPTFWNAFDLASIPTVNVPEPINQLKLSVLTGVAFAYDGTTLSYTCNGTTDLDPCWHQGSWTDAVNGVVTLTLPAGITADQVRGLRVEARSYIGGAVVQWERPSTPALSVNLAMNRRTYLVYGTNGNATTPVPSTRPGMAAAPGETTQGTITNQVSVDGTAGWLFNAAPYTATATTTSTTQLLHRVNQIKVEKTPGKASASSELPRYDLNETIPFRLKVTNTGAWNITGLALTDQVGTVNIGGFDQSGLIPADVSSVFTYTVNGTAVPGFGASLDTTTGNLSITVPNGFVLTSGSVLLITANLRFRDHLEAGTSVSNSVSVTADRDFEKCDFTTDAIAGTALTDVSTCTATTRIVAAASTPITVAKSVKGIAAGDPSASVGDANYNDLGVISVGNTTADLCAAPGTDGYYAPPCTPITRPGGTERWRLTLANGGNVAANTISAIDVLPAVGDTGVTVGTARKSRFTPIFAGNVQVTLPDGAAANEVHTYFLTSAATAACNKSDILNDTTPGGASDCNLNWTEFTDATSAATLATARAIKVTVSFPDATEGIVPGGQFQLTFDTITPAQSDVADATTVEPVAWNSAAIGSRTAYVAQTVDTAEFPARASLITEPRKVGVAIASGRINLAKTVAVPVGAAWTAALPTSYTGTLSCTSLGRDVTLNGAATTTDTSMVSLAGPQGSGTGATANYNADGSSTLPLFASCSFTEDSAQGATAATSPSTVTANTSYTGVANIAHPWAGASTQLLGVTNTYDNAGFTVIKDVTGPVAKDASGADVAFKDFTYTASCQLNGTEVVPEGERTFTLRDGESQQFTGLPAGADCTVAETYAASAAETTITAVQGATTIINNVSSDTAAFTLVAGDASATELTYTNRFTVGATEISKTIVDATGLWGDESFEAHLVCTHPDTTNATVYDGLLPLSKAAPTVTVGSLPTGASCTVTETKTGGANSHSISGATFTVGSNPGSPALVGITNTFTTGSVTVTKKVQANGTDTTAAPWGDGNYPVTLACTRVVDGTTKTLTVAGATQTLKSGAWSHTWTGLPTGATCSATEDTAAITGVGAAQPLAGATVTDPVTVPAGGTGTLTVTNNYTAGKLVINKALTGAGTNFFTTATFSVSCTLGGSTVFSRTGITVTTPSMKSAEIGPIPFGAECTATETATGGADATPTALPVIVTENGATNNVTPIDFTNAFSAGKVTIAKVLSGDAAAAAWATGATFTLAVKCGLAAAGPYSYDGNVSLQGGQSIVLQSSGSDQLFPVGTHCWATETGTGNATVASVDHSTFATGVVVTAQADPSVPQALTITATNQFDYASLTVSKAVVTADVRDQDNNPLVFNRTYTITATCASFNGVTTLTTQTLNFSDQGGGVWGPDVTFNNLPAKASCTVTETAAWGANAITYKVTQNGSTGSAVSGVTKTLALATGVNVVAFTNTYMIGTITLTKVLAGTGTSWATYPFTVHLTCTSNAFSPTTVYNKDFTFTSAADLGPRTITNLPTGASCTVTEPNHHGADAFAATNVTVNTGATIRAARATNTYNTGAVRVTKQLKVNGVLTTTAEPWLSGGYPVTLTCTKDLDGDGSADAVNLGANATKTITGNGTATWTGLPQGANCAATEDTGAITYPAGTPTQPLPTVTVTAAVNVPNDSTYLSPAAITVTNDFGYGSIRIVKTLDGPAAAAWSSGDFDFHTSCTLEGFADPVFEADTTLNKDISLTATGIGPVPVGSVCTVTETNSAWATSITPASATVTLAAATSGGVAEAAFTNTFDFAGFTVQKTVSTTARDASGELIKYTGAYPFTASCKIGADEFLSTEQQSFTLTDGQSKTFDELPAGAICDVTETDALSAASTAITTDQSGHSQTVTSGTSKQFTLVAGGVSASVLEFTNTYATGSLQITKLVSGPGADDWGTGTFTVAAVCSLANATDHSGNALVYANTHQLTKDSPNNFWEITDLPTDASCTVTETNAAGANVSSIDAPNPVIDTSTQVVNITNTFRTGSVKVTKAITANGTNANSGEPWQSGSYPVTLQCIKDFNSDGTAEALDLDSVLGSGYATKTITGAGTAQWDGLPQGATCTVAEGTSAAADQPQPTASVGSTTVGNGTIAPLTLTNEFAAGKLVIHKDITGNADTTWGTGPFEFDVSCTQSGFGEVFSRTGITLTPTTGQTSLDSTALGPIPFSSVCTVTETDSAGATNVTSPSPVTITEDGATANTATASFTNEFTKAGFTVTKAVTSAAKDATDTLISYQAATFAASCQFKGAEAITNAADRTFTLAAGASKTFTDLPTGADCSVTETNPMGAATTDVRIETDSTDATNTGATSANFTLVSGDATATRATFTNNYTVGSAEISKTTLGSGAALWGAGPFTVSLNCTLASAVTPVVYTATHVLNPGETWTVPDLATDASCTVSETQAAGATSTTYSPAATFTVTTSTKSVDVRNTFTVGSVEVTKALLLDGVSTAAEPWVSGTYQVKLACTRSYNGTSQAIDIPGDALPITDPADGVRTIVGAGSVRYDDLPTGASCLVSEVGTSLALPASQVSVQQPDPVVQGATSTATITNDFHTGLLTITKALTGAGAADWADSAAIFDVECTLTDTDEVSHQVFSASDVSLSAATSLTSAQLGPIPVGAECTVTETGTGGASIPAEPAQITIADTADNSVTMTNEYLLGSVIATTEFTLNGIPTTEAPYTGSKIRLELSCERLINGTWVDVAIPGGAQTVINGRGSHTFTGIPVGASCSLAQRAATLTPQGISYRTSTGVTGAATSAAAIIASQPVTLTAIDDFETESLIVEKALAGAGADDFAVHPFKFAISCTLAEDGVAEPHVVYTNNELTLSKTDGLISAGLGPIPVGAECSVTETADGGATAASAAQLVQILAGADNRATLTNTFDAGRVLVTKQVLVDGTASTAEPYASGTYTVQLACTQQVDGATLPVTIPGGDTRTITGSGTAEFAALPTGAACELTESATSLALPSDQVSIDNPTFTIGADPAEVTVTNDFHSSDLLVQVSFTGVGREDFAKPISVEVDCTLAGASGSVLHTVLEVAPTPGQDVTTAGPLGPIPVGAVCTVTALSADGADAIPSVVQVTGEQSTTVVADLAATYSAGTITVTKKITGSGAAQHAEATFKMAITCQQTEGGAAVVSGTVTIVGAGSATLSDATGKPVLAPAHSHCWATETTTDGARKVSVDHHSFATAVHVDPDLPGTLQALTITVTNDFGTAADDLAYTGYALGWGLPGLGLLSIGLGAWLTRRNRRRDDSG
ncbi:DUF5979 domain-containing protein [Propionicimonas sp.]|uniref:DUF5979 domain-containing protein n=1 Tax=Propionicimonas sp. TaxID=1955623 RepID=UPI0017A562D2|nr:DUF5979 domain-containing protein [Propionicimonas sp.]MBU3976012.1 hypothetical protein [Actinomycetota bacterium]MBA3020826.1 hypothetical protein [Propionicimonas sp.]MBU3985202.1 hypothetical protein [Actinomycetota bacterium]MBU4008192.1 hypothetical protein [Actinomycetota bacterium]MBU4064594.1 hypothetical protein [Actinomycetota bacterium]